MTAPVAPTRVVPTPHANGVGIRQSVQDQWAAHPLVLVRAEREGSTKMFPKSDVFRAVAAPYLDAKSALTVAANMSARAAAKQGDVSTEDGATDVPPAPQGSSDAKKAAIASMAMILQESSPKFQVIEGAQTLDDAIDQAANIAALRFEKGGLDASYAVLADQGKYYTAMLMDPKNKSFLITPGADQHTGVTIEFLNPAVKAVVDPYSVARNQATAG